MTAAAFRAAKGAGLEYLADIVRHGLFVSQGHRDDVSVALVLEKSRDYSRVVELQGARLGELGGFSESALLNVIAEALAVAENLGKEESVTDDRGVRVTTRSFESLVRERAETGAVYLLDGDGTDVRSVEFPENPVFVLTDHTPMPKNTYKSMARQGVEKLSLGPSMLHAAQCLTIVLNELDRQRITR